MGSGTGRPVVFIRKSMMRDTIRLCRVVGTHVGTFVDGSADFYTGWPIQRLDLLGKDGLLEEWSTIIQNGSGSLHT